jgi:ADP-ribose pyrophosphatase YjhB (NUDIX family)
MEHYELTVGKDFFDEMARKRRASPGEVIMVIRRPGGKVLVNTKSFYPAGVYRLPSGQINRGEDPEATLMREAFEETGLRVRIERHLGVIRYTLRCAEETLNYISHVFLTEETAGEPAPMDASEAISGFREIEPSELRSITEALRNLPESWSDWGRFRALAHESVYRKLCA